LYADRIEDKEKRSFWNNVQIRNRILIKNPGSRTDFEINLNLLGIQTYLENSYKFPKILIYLSLPEYEFRVTWLYGKIQSFHACSS
jgi:hypothetical protein